MLLEGHASHDSVTRSMGQIAYTLAFAQFSKNLHRKGFSTG